jgi:hypothetical protein
VQLSNLSRWRHELAISLSCPLPAPNQNRAVSDCNPQLGTLRRAMKDLLDLPLRSR